MKKFIAFLLITCCRLSLFAQAPRVFPEGERPDDARLKPLKELNGFFPFEVPKSLEAWEQRAAELRLRILVATGLYPQPPKTPLNAVIHGKFERPGFTVEKVYFESYPGLFVTGLLFRPSNPPPGKLPAVLSPHGHGGRLQDHGLAGVRREIASGAALFEESGRMPKLVRNAQLARMGCVTFLYDMLGYADNLQLSMHLAHRFGKQRPDFEGKESWGLYSAQAEMRMQSIFGIQAWNSIRALDFLASLPDVDPKRIAVTGGSGGGTQTIILGATDSRPVVGFPNGMVSSSMQGGCTCENASLLRIGTGNVELAALFAPRPQGMTAANDWTKEMLVKGKGFYEIQDLYALYGKKDEVICPALLRFPHNYNTVSRGHMYSWFNKHLGLGIKEPIAEKDYKLFTKEEHAVWTDKHPKPPGGDAFERKLTRQLADQDSKILDAMSDKDRRATVLKAWKIMIGRELPTAADIELDDGKLSFPAKGEVIPIRTYTSTRVYKKVVIWVHGKGKDGLYDDEGKPIEALRRLHGTRVILADLFLQGEFLAPGKTLTRTPTVRNRREYAGYTHGYNHSVFARRTHDILSLIALAKKRYDNRPVCLVATGGAAPVAAAALAIAGPAVSKAILETGDFTFADIKSYRHPDFIPGAVKYGDLKGLLDLIPKDSIRTVKAFSGDDLDWLGLK